YKAYDNAAELRRRARYSLRRQLAELQRHGDTQLGAAEEHASAGCARAYALSGAAPAATRLALAVSFDARVRDGPLLHLIDDSQDNEKYMKLVVEKKRLRLTWDLGSGAATIVHPETLQATHDDADQTSYRIEIERIWNTVHLKLERMGGGTPVTATNSSAPSAVRLTGSQLWLGGRDGAGGLPGCVHALYADDASVGLWNFQHQPKESQCTGCTQRWYNPGGGGRGGGGGAALAWFGGGGYAELRRGGLRAPDSRQFSVALTFRTRDENALLFMALDAANNRSVSLELVACRVVFSVRYGGARLRVAAGGRHCDARPAHVHAIRLFAADRLER
ncbi:uncharacterized protein LOC114352127, partial [Ostrinia furnacalis]|uniref:uncharacterized protein LOC114352127 n=1 Tax=Ostrinia furnacalis TaxID=93504 RepID=UPI00103A5E4A